MGDVTLLPSAAVDAICHEEQMTVWTGELVGAFSMADLFKDLSYDEVILAHQVAGEEIRRIIRSALDHPEARTVIRPHT